MMDFLRNVFIFGGLEDVELVLVERIASIRSYKKGDVIFREDDKANEFFIVEKGLVAINKNVAGGRKRNLANFGPGETFGELAMFDAEPRSASVEAVDTTSVLAISIEEFQTLLAQNPVIAAKVQARIIQKLSERIRNTNNLINEGVIWGFKMAS